jgi:hypothetical protein
MRSAQSGCQEENGSLHLRGTRLQPEMRTLTLSGHPANRPEFRSAGGTQTERAQKGLAPAPPPPKFHTLLASCPINTATEGLIKSRELTNPRSDEIAGQKNTTVASRFASGLWAASWHHKYAMRLPTTARLQRLEHRPHHKHAAFLLLLLKYRTLQT